MTVLDAAGARQEGWTDAEASLHGGAALAILKEHATGGVSDLLRRHAISKETFYLWRKNYDGFQTGQIAVTARKSKRVYWELMSQPEEAGEEDACSLLNQVMGAQPYFGSGADLAEYLEALTALEAKGELRVRGYRIDAGRTVYLDVRSGSASRPAAWFSFDPFERMWKWNGIDRQMVEVPDH